MRTIAVEEHYLSQAFVQYARSHSGGSQAFQGNFFPGQQRLEELGEMRLQDMDAAGIDLAVISHVAPGRLGQASGAEMISLVQEANGQLVAAIEQHPDRFAGLALLPMTEPQEAADELERMVNTHGFLGAMISGTVAGRFLDDPSFMPVLERAVALDVPIYIHPGEPPDAVRQAYYSGLDPMVGTLLATAGWGWHSEAAIHILRLVLSGVFDKLPNLQIMSGHLGEMIPFMLDRIDHTFAPATRYLKRPVKDYLLQNVVVSTSGVFADPVFTLAMETFGADRILFSVDYPFHRNQEGRDFLNRISLSDEDREKVCHANAERVLKILA